MKKHFICTHTYMSDEIKDKFFEDTKNLTDKELFDGMKTEKAELCLLYTSPSPRDGLLSRMPSSA